jgi:hypothetical protein
VNKRRIAAAGVLVFLTGIDLKSGPAFATVGLKNDSGIQIEHMYTVSADETGWSLDILSTPLLAGQSRLISQTPCEELDVRLVDSEGRECVFESMSLCRNNPCDLLPSQGMEGAEGTWVLTATQMAGCAGFGQ